MRRTIVRLAACAALVHLATTVIVTPDSACDQQCGNVLDATTPADIVCDQHAYGSTAGVVFKNCVTCEIASTAYQTNPNQSDQQWALYNSRYALSYCLFGQPGNDPAYLASTPCITSNACGPFSTALQHGNLSTDPSIGAYDYCAAWQDQNLYEGCVNCLRSDERGAFLANMVVHLQVGCNQRPALGATVSVSGSIFSTTLMNESEPTPTSTWTANTDSGPLSLGAKVGIAIGGFCLLLVAAGFFIVCNGRRRRRAFLRKLEMRQKEAGAGWPHPSYASGGGGGHGDGAIINRGPDMNDTPLSQKPLRSWDDSPQSATVSEPGSYPRYFSPYASQQTSPVNTIQSPQHQWPHQFHDEPTYGGFPSSSIGADYPTMQDHSFPSAAQEKAAQDQHEAAAAAAAGAANAPLHIGLALGGDEPSLRSKQSEASREEEANGGEAYELHEVSSSAGGSSAGGMNHGGVAGSSQSFRSRVPRENQAPILQHPGYGRYSPERGLPPPPAAVHSMSGGLKDGAENGS